MIIFSKMRPRGFRKVSPSRRIGLIPPCVTCMLLVVLSLTVVMSTAYALDKKDKKDKKNKGEEAPALFYPGLPEQPRLQFLRTISSEKDIQPKSGGFRKFVMGDKEETQTLNKPYGVAIHDGTIFACDTIRNCVALFDLKEKAFSRMGDRPPGRLSKPINIAIDTDGTRYVADSGHKRIMVYDGQGKYKRAIGDPEKMGPTDVVIFEDRLYVCDIDNGQVVVLDKASGDEVRRFGSKGSGEGEFFFPTHLAVDSDANVYVCDTGNARVVKFDSHDNVVQQFGKIGTGLGHFSRPKGIAVDRSGNLFVVDAAFENVQLFDRDGQLLLFFGGPGNGPGGMNLPAKVVIDYDNVKYFKDRVAPGYEIEYLVLVCSQFGLNKINVYGYIKTDN